MKKQTIFLMKRTIVLFLLLLSICILSGCNVASFYENENINCGVLDLSQWEGKQQGTISLTGTWEFYWGKFIEYNDLENNKPDLYASVGRNWQGHILDGKKLPREGYGTYRLHIKSTLPPDTILAFYIDKAVSASRIYINDRLINESGVASSNASHEIVEYKSNVVLFAVPSGDFDLIIQVSNHHRILGPFSDGIFLGTLEGIQNQYDFYRNCCIIAIVSALFLSILVFAICFLQNEPDYIYLGFMLLLIVIYIYMRGLIYFLYNDVRISMEDSFIICNSIWIWVELLYLHYLSKLYQVRITIIDNFYKIISIIFQFGIVINAIYKVNAFIYLLEGFLLSEFIYAFYILIKGRNKYNTHWIFDVISLNIIFISVLNVAINQNNISGFVLSYFCTYIAILIQAINIAYKIKALQEKKFNAELMSLRAQLRPNFLFSTLNAFLDLSTTNINKAIDLLYSFTDYLRKSFDFKDISIIVPLKQELELAASYLAVEKVRLKGCLEVSFYIDPEIDQSVGVPSMMLQPLIENTIVHIDCKPNETEKINVIIRKSNSRIDFRIESQIDPKAYKSLFKTEMELANINMRLNMLYGTRLTVCRCNRVTELKWYVVYKSF